MTDAAMLTGALAIGCEGFKIGPHDVPCIAISAHYVRQLISDEGTSFSDYLTEKRLSYVYDCLTDPRQIMRRVADIAFDVGFIEPSTFYRQFRLRYGMTPTDVRQAA
ncbi:AraC family transcriptional regulator [Phyllobacterium salinisoli]|uniref:AraC family transcriptional regulator n=1 Tax=Phyllobacterium salinisoli TaxID=1899321 RepID=A0A368K2Z7_9HYPH|nr:AraC family transcriptional regulator [Phyllobacterium salinisoli]RCS22772.1 AraC family transcriptional regulator [Phyllobacterium salinisoli]